MLVINIATSFCDALTLPIAEYIVLQAKCLHIDLLEYREKQCSFFLAFFKVFHCGVTSLVILIHIPLLEFFIILHPLNEIVGFQLHSISLIVTSTLEKTLKLFITV